MRWTIFLFALVGCGQGVLTPEWLLDRTRILGARATPVEAAPGDLVTWEALTYGATGVMWSTCYALAGMESACPRDDALREELRALDWTTLEGEERAGWEARAREEGIFGIQPGWDPILPIPEEFALLLASPEIGGAVSIAVQIEAWDAAGDLETAGKYLRVSLSDTPNLAPTLTGFTVGDSPAALLAYRAGGQLTVTAQVAEGSAEPYLYVNSEGIEEERIEDLELRFYASAGEFEGRGPAFNHDPWAPSHTAAQVLTSEEPDEGELIAVVLDGRGGVDWARIPLFISP